MLKFFETKYYLKRILKKGEISLVDFIEKSRVEVNETKEAKKLLVKYVVSGEMTDIERHELKTQTFDLFKIILIGIPLAIIPGFSVILVIVVKVGRKYKLNILPTSFTSKSE